ncbi:MAG: hypothetical protein ACR2GX_03845 [Candidatus Dormibacteria bacterium]
MSAPHIHQGATRIAAIEAELRTKATSLKALRNQVGSWDGQATQQFLAHLHKLHADVSAHSAGLLQASSILHMLADDLQVAGQDPVLREQAYRHAAVRLDHLTGAARMTGTGSAAQGRAGHRPAPAATNGKKSHHYFTTTTLAPGTVVLQNLPGHGRAHYLRKWLGEVQPGKSGLHHVSVRYVVHVRGQGDWAMVLDNPNSHQRLHWGFVPTHALADGGVVHDSNGNVVTQTQHAVGGDGNVKFVPMQAAHAKAEALHRVHITSAGTLRDYPKAFAIGTVNPGDVFEAAHTAPRHGWVLGLDKTTHTWGWVAQSHIGKHG